jgi:glycosyltransferase involved in cell wall biosynthesis
MAAAPALDRSLSDHRGPAVEHIVFVCLVFHPDSAASSLLFTDLFRRLARKGTRVTVLTGFPSKDSAAQVASLPRSDRLDGIEIIRCGVRIRGKRNLFTRAIAYGSFLAHAGWKLLRLDRNARIVGGTDPPFTAIVLWLLSHIRRLDYECILLDIYPDGLVGLGSLRDRSLLTRLWRALNRLSYRRARQLTVIGRDMVTLLGRRYGIDAARVTYIPHWATEEVDRLPGTAPNGFLKDPGLEGKFVVQYSGNMGIWHDMESFVRAAEHLRDVDRIHFLFIGNGTRREAARQLSRSLGLRNVTWLDFLPREQLGESLAACDVALISMRAGLEGVAVPSKLYGILAAGRAVIAQVPRESEVAYTLADEGCGRVVEPGDVDGLVTAIRSLAGDPELVGRMGARALAAYRSKYSLDQAVASFESLWQLPSPARYEKFPQFIHNTAFEV